MIEVTVDDSEFVEWVEYTRGEFLSMVQTLIDVAEMIGTATEPYVPYKTGALEGSFKYTVVESSSDFIELEMGYDATDPRDNYIYAEYQFIGRDWRTGRRLNHPIKGESFYLTKGIRRSLADAFELIEVDYMSLFGGRL